MIDMETPKKHCLAALEVHLLDFCYIAADY